MACGCESIEPCRAPTCSPPRCCMTVASRASRCRGAHRCQRHWATVQVAHPSKLHMPDPGSAVCAQTGDAQAAMKPIKSKAVADGLFDGAYRMASLWLWKSEGFWKAALEHVDCGLPIPPWWGRAHGRYSSCAEPGLAKPKKVVHNAGFMPEGCPKNLLWIKKLSRKRAFVSRSVLQGKLRLPFFIARVGCSLDWPIRIGSVAHLRGPGYA